ncbi:phospholipase D domain protein [Leptospira ryugenii]|uniref:Phospholipase D domain protein n=1 Tax=Leptospira ryugenii TaxID=1917863 RepID=A0A2P2DZW3_9LEPT|nr:phospholipase D family protein [Leptospira ryugenii]GBF50184.1 phospholipase D domain protein [Leptospira ryugenii]
MRLSLGSDFYEDFLTKRIPLSQTSIWIATADIKNLHIKKGSSFVPFLSILSEALERGVEVKLLHAKEPGQRFRAEFDRFPLLLKSKSFKRALCPRVHLKTIILDRKIAYIGSANLTGAGMGAKSEHKRNFEAGIISDDPKIIREIESYFNSIFSGKYCVSCLLRKVCPDPIL